MRCWWKGEVQEFTKRIHPLRTASIHSKLYKDTIDRLIFLSGPDGRQNRPISSSSEPAEWAYRPKLQWNRSPNMYGAPNCAKHMSTNILNKYTFFYFILSVVWVHFHLFFGGEPKFLFWVVLPLFPITLLFHVSFLVIFCLTRQCCNQKSSTNATWFQLFSFKRKQTQSI